MKLGLGLRISANRIVDSYESAYTSALVARAQSDGYDLPAQSVLSALDTMLSSLESNSIDTKLHALWILATSNANFAKYNVLDPANYYCTGGPNFFANEGFNPQGNGANILNTNFNPSGIVALNNASIFAWVLDTPASNGATQTLIGSEGNLTAGYCNSPVTATFYKVNTGSVGISSIVSAGLVHANRADASTHKLFNNGNQLDSEADASVSVISGNVAIGAANVAGAEPAVGRIAIAGVGQSLESEASTLYSIFNTYMTSI